LLLAVVGSARADGPAASGLPMALDRFGLWGTDRAEVEEQLGLGFRLDFSYLRDPIQLGGMTPINNYFDMRGGLQLGLFRKMIAIGVSAPAGDLRAYLKIVPYRGNVMSIGIVLAAFFPTGDPKEYRSDDVYGGEPKVVIDVRWRWLSFIANVGARLHFPTVTGPLAPARLEIGPELIYSLAFAFELHKRVTLSLEAVGSEAFTPDVFGTAQRTSAMLLSMFVKPGANVQLFFGVGKSIAVDAARTDLVRLHLGVSWGSGSLLKAAPTPTGAQPPTERLPTIDPKADRDGDGIKDLRDRCPDDVEDKDGYEDGDGCPDMDNDGDGIADAKDRCPNEGETQNGLDDEDGCPDTVGVAQSGTPFNAPSPMLYAANATLPRDKTTLGILDRLADALFAHPEVKRLRIEGHAWQEKRAQELSQRRADEVRQYLIDRGIDGKRIQAVGYGEARPADADNAPKNRRVEFIVVE
jgi:outer membrane protein OmpA-like peptidoglycan-associated protein